MNPSNHNDDVFAAQCKTYSPWQQSEPENEMKEIKSSKFKSKIHNSDKSRIIQRVSQVPFFHPSMLYGGAQKTLLWECFHALLRDDNS